jgi:nitroimidazol reductase NimA-like FMN-containing flavoprotein (pyridoxamine 5'-phosphate oxidase superfamily)
MTDNDQPEASLDELTRAECLALVASRAVGRHAVCRKIGPPLVVPLNNQHDGEVIVFRTDPGAKLSALQRQAVSFEVDEIDPAHHSGWSVLIEGLAFVSDEAPPTASVEPWAPGRKGFWVSISPASITGRRLTLAPVPPDGRAYL